MQPNPRPPRNAVPARTHTRGPTPSNPLHWCVPCPACRTPYLYGRPMSCKSGSASMPLVRLTKWRQRDRSRGSGPGARALVLVVGERDRSRGSGGARELGLVAGVVLVLSLVSKKVLVVGAGVLLLAGERGRSSGSGLAALVIGLLLPLLPGGRVVAAPPPTVAVLMRLLAWQLRTTCRSALLLLLPTPQKCAAAAGGIRAAPLHQPGRARHCAGKLEGADLESSLLYGTGNVMVLWNSKAVGLGARGRRLQLGSTAGRGGAKGDPLGPPRVRSSRLNPADM